ncbi:unnamed protein product [Pleuronectes platessa]|uniref:Uncharacterized protein n=1 Tax=Pleuronectes platessa TaxID=8262 RepID=A0A9N7YXS2_PLEPL|nr:unnamed protein product [Pleuronectes platessa]
MKGKMKNSRGNVTEVLFCSTVLSGDSRPLQVPQETVRLPVPCLRVLGQRAGVSESPLAVGEEHSPGVGCRMKKVTEAEEDQCRGGALWPIQTTQDQVQLKTTGCRASGRRRNAAGQTAYDTAASSGYNNMASLLAAQTGLDLLDKLRKHKLNLDVF